MADCVGSVEIGAQYADCAHCKSLLPGAAPAAAAAPVAVAAPVTPEAAAATTNGASAGEHKSSPTAAAAPAPVVAQAPNYAAKLAEKLRHVESTVAAAEHVEGAVAAAAAVTADTKVDAKSDVKVAEPETKHALAPAAPVEAALSPSARAYADRLRDRLTRAANVVAAAAAVTPSAASSAASPASAAASPRSTKAADAPAVAAKRIVLGPTVRDAVTRLSNGFEVLVYAVTAEHKVCTRRSYTVWFSVDERALCWAAGSAKLLVPNQRLPVSELTHIYFGAQTKAFDFAQSAVGGSAAINSGLCVSLLTPKTTLDIEALSKNDFRAFLACLNTVLESYGKLTFLERSSASPDVETRRFRIVPAADLDDDPLQLTAAGTVASAGPAPLTAAAVGGLPNVWIAPGSTRMVFPATVGTHGFRAESGQPLNTDITSLSRSAVPFLNPHLNDLHGRAAPLRIHLDPNGLTEADALRGNDGTDVVLRDPAAGVLAADETLYVADADGDSDAETDPVRARTATAAPAASAGRAAAAAPATNGVLVARVAPPAAAAAAAKPAPPTHSSAPGAVVRQGVTVKRTDALAGALMQGLVWKAAGVFKRWESRYVALVGRYFFKYDTPSAPLGATLGHPLPLDLCTFEACGQISANMADPTKGPAFLFRVMYKPVGTGGAPREWVLGVSSDAVRQHWLKALSIAKPLIAAKVAGKRAWTEHDIVANNVAALAYQTH